MDVRDEMIRLNTLGMFQFGEYLKEKGKLNLTEDQIKGLASEFAKEQMAGASNEELSNMFQQLAVKLKPLN